jgi:uncharacterized membrane protein
MKKEKLKLKYTKFQIVMEIISLLILIGMFLLILIRWGELPDKIPGHYNYKGEIDRWGNKSEIITVPIISFFLYLLLTITVRFPSIWNVPVQVTDKNKELVYGCIKSMVIMLKAEVMTNFFFLTYNDIETKPLSSDYLQVILTVVFGTLIFFILRMVRLSKRR